MSKYFEELKENYRYGKLTELSLATNESGALAKLTDYYNEKRVALGIREISPYAMLAMIIHEYALIHYPGAIDTHWPEDVEREILEEAGIIL